MQPTFESLEDKISLTRNRHFTDEEFSHLVRHTRHMAYGTEVVELLSRQESGLVGRAMNAITGDFPAADQQQPGATETLRQVMTLALRQAALGMALDDGSRYFDFLVDLQRPLWATPMNPALVEGGFARLREECARTLGEPRVRLFDGWLRVGQKFLTANAIVARQRQELLDGTLGDLQMAEPAMAQNLPAHLRRTLDLLLQHAVQGLLPDGPRRNYAFVAPLVSRLFQSEKAPQTTGRAAELLRRNAEAHLPRAGSGEVLASLGALQTAITAAADVSARLEDILREAGLPYDAEQSRSAVTLNQSFAFQTSPYSFILQQAILLGLPGRPDEVLRQLTEFEHQLAHINANAREVADNFQAVLEACRSQLAGSTIAEMEENLLRLTHYVAFQADLAQTRDGVIEKILADHERKYESLYLRKGTTAAYGIRDLEQTLHNIALMIFPEASLQTVSRFSLYGEYILTSKPNGAMMAELYDMLERECRAAMMGQTLVRLLPAMQRIRSWFDVVVALQEHEEAIITKTHAEVMQKFPREHDKYENGKERLTTDLRTQLRTCAASLMPGGEAVLHRGFRAVLGVIVELKMDKGLWDAVGKGLAKNAAVLPKGAKDKLVPVLDRGAGFLHVAGDYGATLDAITAGAADAVLAKFPPLGTRVIGARGLLVEVFEAYLVEAALGILPGGDKAFAAAMGELVDRLLDGRLQGPEIAEGFDALRKLAAKQLDSASRTALGPLLDKGAAALMMAGELAAEEEFLLSDTVSQLVSRHTLFAENLPNFSSQMKAELRRVLRLAVLQSAPGGDSLSYAGISRMATRLARLRFKAAIARDAGELLVAGLNRLVRTHAFAKAIVKTVQQMGESLALLVEVAENEDNILRTSMDRLVAKHGQKADHLREGRGRKTAMNDERMMLRSCARNLLPGSEEHHREVLDMERIAIERYNIDKALVREAFTILQDTVKEFVKAPSAAELRNNIQKSTAYVVG